MIESVYEEFEVVEIIKMKDQICLESKSKAVIAEISLKVIVNGEELVSLLCLNQLHVELALGFLYSEGVINTLDDCTKIHFNERLHAVVIELREGVLVDRQASLRSVTSGCGKCYTYINPLKREQYKKLENTRSYSIDNILQTMKTFMSQSELFKEIGGVHSILFQFAGGEYLIEDIGRHNCFDKIIGMLLLQNQMNLAQNALIYVSGRISSEIVTKVLRLGTQVIVSRSTPTTSAIRLAQQFNITLMGYVRGERGFIYSIPERIIP